MADQRANVAELAVATDSHGSPTKPRRKRANFDVAALLQNLFWTVPETAFICRVGVRTVWRLMADPESGFPRPRQVGGRTLLSRDAVLTHMGLPAGDGG